MSMTPGLQLSEPHSKSPRRDSDSISQPLNTFMQDKTYWYNDGNIVVVAQGVGFRVFKGLLAEVSEVFRDLFALPQPSSDTREPDAIDCPVVHVTDTADQFRSLLDMLLHGRRYAHKATSNKIGFVIFSYFPGTCNTSRSVSTILRIAPESLTNTIARRYLVFRWMRCNNFSH